jgi:hypothetical protein
MPMNDLQTCLICGHRTDRMACAKCQNRIAGHLSDILKYTALAAGELQPGQGGDGRGSERGLGIRLDALDLMAGNEILDTLESWERMYREEWGYAPWGPTTLERAQGKQNPTFAYFKGTVAFLRGNLDRICDHPAVDDFANETRQMYYRTRSIARQQPPQAYRVNCPADTQDGECGNSLRFTSLDMESEVGCKRCGSVWTVKRLILVNEAAGKSIWTDIEAAAGHFAVHPTTLSKWAKAGHITKRGNQVDLKSIRAHIELGKQLARDMAELAQLDST